MDLFQNFLNNTAYYYYAKNISSSDERILDTIENKRFMKLLHCWPKGEPQLQKVLLDLEKETPSERIEVNQTSRSFPSYEIELFNYINESHHSVTKVYVSFFIPFYFVVNVIGNKENGIINSNYDINARIDLLLETSLKKNFNYSKFPYEISDKVIPDLIIEKEFNYIKAFFTDYYRIVRF